MSESRVEWSGVASALLLVSIVQMWPSAETKARPVREVRRLGGLLQPRREPAQAVEVRQVESHHVETWLTRHFQ